MLLLALLVLLVLLLVLYNQQQVTIIYRSLRCLSVVKSLCLTPLLTSSEGLTPLPSTAASELDGCLGKRSSLTVSVITTCAICQDLPRRMPK